MSHPALRCMKRLRIWAWSWIAHQYHGQSVRCWWLYMVSECKCYWCFWNPRSSRHTILRSISTDLAGFEAAHCIHSIEATIIMIILITFDDFLRSLDDCWGCWEEASMEFEIKCDVWTTFSSACIDDISTPLSSNTTAYWIPRCFSIISLSYWNLR